MWWQKHKWHVILPLLVVLVLAGAFWYGGGAPGLQGWTVADNTQTDNPVTTPDPGETNLPQDNPAEANSGEQTQQPEQEDTQDNPGDTTQPKQPAAKPQENLTPAEKVAAAAEIAGAAGQAAQGSESYSKEQGMEIDPATGKDKYNTDPVPEGKPLPVEPENAVITDEAYTCTISISCASILAHMDWLADGKAELVPEDGVILAPTEVTFYGGESVFNVLQRVCKQNKIHMEFMNTPMYNSAYIEGINNLYEFDCGELSGWMYSVNDWFPNYGCSRYQLSDGDVICWKYTCDLGVDVNGFYATGE